MTIIQYDLNFVAATKRVNTVLMKKASQYIKKPLFFKFIFYLRVLPPTGHIPKLLVTPTFLFSVPATFYQFSMRSKITFVEIFHLNSKRKSLNKYKCALKTLLMNKAASTHKPMHAYIFSWVKRGNRDGKVGPHLHFSTATG